jgi:hypothetical protein
MIMGILMVLLVKVATTAMITAIIIALETVLWAKSSTTSCCLLGDVTVANWTGSPVESK